MESLLQVKRLTVDLALDRRGRFPVVSDASFDVRPGEIAGLFGESGCGKTTLALALLGLLPPDRYFVRGSIRLRGRELAGLGESQLEQVRGAEVSLILQEPVLALNPVMRVRDQVAEVIRAHRRWDAARCRREAESALRLAGLPDSARLRGAYPHQLSGGERQRVAIAQALACRPALVVADEPFTALDAGLQLELSSLFREWTEKLGISFLLISHSPGVLARVADHVLVMYGGRIVEQGGARQVLEDPLHPYTAGLLRSFAPGPRNGFSSIPGNAPDLASRPRGCPCEPRCEDRTELCVAEMPLEFQPEERRLVRCYKHAC
ncbi:MAG: ABC transporter ATP-binding protein [Acidobacteria bacterium]|nr:ABC transporter ATP-binding protein [Acidobacteriota bacterium]